MLLESVEQLGHDHEVFMGNTMVDTEDDGISEPCWLAQRSATVIASMARTRMERVSRVAMTRALR